MSLYPTRRLRTRLHRLIPAITQAICRYRKLHGIDGPLFMGMDTHAISAPAHASVLEVLAANGVDVMIASGYEYTPTPFSGTEAIYKIYAESFQDHGHLRRKDIHQAVLWVSLN